MTTRPRFRLFVTLCAALWVMPVAAQPGDLAGFGFLRLESSAQAAALGGSWIPSGVSDVAAMFYNPAQINEQMDGYLTVSYLNHLSDINAGMVGYAREYAGIGTFAAGIRFLSWGSLDEADENGERTGSFSAGDLAFTVGGSRMYSERLRYGANVHLIYSSISSYSASALAIDVGAVYLLTDGVTLSGSVNNGGITLSSFGSSRDKLPVDVRVGVSTRLEHLPLTISVLAYNLHDFDTADPDASGMNKVLEHVAVGGEFRFSPSFKLRVGYNHRRHEALRMKNRLDFAGVGFGAGIKVKRVFVDYAYNSWSSVGGLNQFSVSTRI